MGTVCWHVVRAQRVQISTRSRDYVIDPLDGADVALLAGYALSFAAIVLSLRRDRDLGFVVSATASLLLSPLLWDKVRRGISAGRVQSVAVRMIVEREREIRAFVPEEYWEIKAHLKTAAAQDLLMDVRRYQGQNFRPANKAETEEALARLREAAYVVAKREDKPTSTKPPAPFITSTGLNFVK